MPARSVENLVIGNLYNLLFAKANSPEPALNAGAAVPFDLQGPWRSPDIDRSGRVSLWAWMGFAGRQPIPAPYPLIVRETSVFAVLPDIE